MFAPTNHQKPLQSETDCQNVREFSSGLFGCEICSQLRVKARVFDIQVRLRAANDVRTIQVMQKPLEGFRSDTVMLAWPGFGRRSGEILKLPFLQKKTRVRIYENLT